jgi:hypothetical protein
MQYVPCMWLGRHDFGMVAWIVASVISMLLVVFPHWELCVRMYALLDLILGNADNFETALISARKKSFFILFINAPTILSDMYLLAIVSLSSYMLNQGSKGTSHAMEAAFGLALDVLIWLLVLPIICLSIINLFYVATLVAEKLTVWECCKRCIYFMRSQFLFITGYSIIMGVFYLLIESPVELVSLLQLAADRIPGFGHEIAIIGVFLVETVLIAPLTAFIAGTLTIASACLHGQLAMRLECSDIVRRLSLPSTSQQAN